jgi:hypothetical protein
MPATTETTNPLAAIPLIATGVEVRRDSEALVHVQRRVEARPGFFNRIARGIGGARSVRVNLDVHGSFFWDRIDGQRTLAEIAADLQSRFGIEPAAARQATVMFTRMLMLRHIIQLKVER